MKQVGHWVIAASVAVGLGLGGCGSKAPTEVGAAETRHTPAAEKPVTPVPSVAEPTAAVPAAKKAGATRRNTIVEPKPEPSGLAAKDNDPTLVERTEAFKNCALEGDRLSGRCSDAGRALMKGFDRSQVPTVVNFLSDPALYVRYAGAFALERGNLLRTPTARRLMPRILASVAAERNPHIARLLGEALLQGPYEDDGFKGEIKDLITRHPSDPFKIALVSNLPAQDYRTFFPILKDRLATEKNAALRQAIMKSFYTQSHKPGACDFFVAHLADTDVRVAASAAYNIIWSNGGCVERYDVFLAHFEQRVTKREVSFMYLLSAKYMAQAKGASDGQKIRFIDALETVVNDTSLKGMVRATALKAIGDHSVTGKVFAQKLLADPDKSVSAAAKRIVEAR
ncbi:MAG: hypothetical protein ACI9MR_004052 [Myxococcota bacterium]|jgi:hypothetical protein